MRNVVTILIVLLCVGVIVAGKIHWENKIAAVGAEAHEQYKKIATNESDEETESKPQLNYTKNLPADIVSKIENAMETGKPVQFVMVGSESTSTSPEGWPAIVTKSLQESYGESVFQTIVKEYPELNSNKAIELKIFQEIIELQPDILLLEPFSLNDNGVVPITNALANIETIIKEIESKLPDVKIILQPSEPVYKAIYYPKEVVALKDFAKEKGYLYLDHWTSWPDFNSEEFLSFTTENGNPNEKGNQIWAKYVTDFFISE